MGLVKEVEWQFSSKFDMKDLGAMNFNLGMEVKRDGLNRKLWVNQRKYVEIVLQCFHMHACKLVKVPISAGENLYVEQCPKTQE